MKSKSNFISAIIVDDEGNCRESLSMLITEFCKKVKIESIFTNINDAEIFLKSSPIDLVFLDVEMPHGTGIELLDRFPNRKFEVIFTTAYDTYAIPALKRQAVDYLLKPIGVDELIEAVDKIAERIGFNSIQNDIIDETKLLLPAKNGLQAVAKSEIFYCEADGPYTWVYFSNSKLLITKNLGEIELLINEKSFFRIHHGLSVNLDQVDVFQKGETSYLILKNGIKLEVARRRKKELIEKIKTS